MSAGFSTPPRRPRPAKFVIPTAAAAAAAGRTPPTGCLLDASAGRDDGRAASLCDADAHLLRTVLWSAWLHDLQNRESVTGALLALRGRHDVDEDTKYSVKVMLASASSRSLKLAIAALPATHTVWVWEALVEAADSSVLATAYLDELHALAVYGRDDERKVAHLLGRLDARPLYKMQWKYVRRYVADLPSVRTLLEQAGVSGSLS